MNKEDKIIEALYFLAAAIEEGQITDITSYLEALMKDHE